MTATQKSVMIIEDEPDAAELFAEMMRLNGYRVLKTYSGTPAMTLIAQEKPDVIILDIMMPDVSGLEVLRNIRKTPELAALPVVFEPHATRVGEVPVLPGGADPRHE